MVVTLKGARNARLTHAEVEENFRSINDKPDDFATRAALVAAVAAGTTTGANGRVVTAAGLAYRWQVGATAISDLPGLVPVDPVYADHFGGGIEGINAALAGGYVLHVGPGEYDLESAEGPYFNGYIQLQNGSHIKGTPGAVWKQKSWSLTLDPTDVTPPIAQGPRGSFIGNAGGYTPTANGSSPDSITSEVVIDNPPIIDGSEYPAPFEFVLPAQSPAATTTSFTLPSGASSVDDYYNGLVIQFLDGDAAYGVIAFVTDYVGSTRRVTCSTLLGTPAEGDTIQIGYNDLGFGFAHGASNIRLVNAVVKNYSDVHGVPPVAGAKAINFEQGVYNATVEGGGSESVGVDVFIQGKDGTHVNGELKQSSLIKVRGRHAENAGALAVFFGDDADNDAPNDMSVVYSDATYHNAGHRPYRIVRTDQQKSGILVFGGANSVKVRNVVGYNDSTYPDTSPGYPTDWPFRVGYGLSGNVGALVWGFGRHIGIDGFQHSGDLDTVFHFGRPRASGVDGGDGASGAILSCKNWQARGIDVHGAVTNILRLDDTSTFRPANGVLTGYLEVTVTSVTAIVHADAATYDNIVLDVTERGTGKRIIGTPQQIYNVGNTFSAIVKSDGAMLDLRKGPAITLADDTATFIQPPEGWGVLMVESATSLLRALYAFRTAGSSVQLAFLSTTPANCAVDATDGTLTGTTGSDAFFTLRAALADATYPTGRIYFENRRGSNVTFNYKFL